MALGQYVGNQGAQANRNLPGTGGKAKVPGKAKVKAKRRLSAKERAEAQSAADPYGQTQTGGAKQKRVVRKKVRRKRVGPKTVQTSDLNKAAKQQTTAKAGRPGRAAGAQGAGNSSWMFPQMNAQSGLQQMHQQFSQNKAQQSKGPQTPTGQKFAQLGRLQSYIQNDYAMMKANPNDKAFTYRTAEARQLEATIGTMLAGATKQGKSKDDKKTSNDSRLTPAAFAQKKGLLRNLLAMSEPNAPLPEGLPQDYKPFEGVA